MNIVEPDHHLQIFSCRLVPSENAGPLRDCQDCQDSWRHAISLEVRPIPITSTAWEIRTLLAGSGKEHMSVEDSDHLGTFVSHICFILALPSSSDYFNHLRTL